MKINVNSRLIYGERTEQKKKQMTKNTKAKKTGKWKEILSIQRIKLQTKNYDIFYDFLLSSCRLFSCFIKVTLKRLYGFLSFTDRYLGWYNPTYLPVQLSNFFFHSIFLFITISSEDFYDKTSFYKEFSFKAKSYFLWTFNRRKRAIALISSYPIMAGISFKLMELNST